MAHSYSTHLLLACMSRDIQYVLTLIEYNILYSYWTYRANTERNQGKILVCMLELLIKI